MLAPISATKVVAVSSSIPGIVSQSSTTVCRGLFWAVAGASAFAPGAANSAVPVSSGGTDAGSTWASKHRISASNFAVFLVRFSSRHLLDVMRVHQKQMELLLHFQDVPHRFPINSGSLHGNRLHPQARFPSGYLPQVAGHRPELSFFRAPFPILIDQQHTGRDAVLVHVHAATTLVNYPHDRLLILNPVVADARGWLSLPLVLW